MGPDSSCTGVEPFSNFDGQQLCSPLTYRPHISIIERSKPVMKCVKISRGWQHFKGGFCPVKVTSFCQCLFTRWAVWIAPHCRLGRLGQKCLPYTQEGGQPLGTQFISVFSADPVSVENDLKLIFVHLPCSKFGLQAHLRPLGKILSQNWGIHFCSCGFIIILFLKILAFRARKTVDHLQSFKFF